MKGRRQKAEGRRSLGFLTSAFCLLLSAFLAAYHYLPRSLPPRRRTPEIIAHRGVAQYYPPWGVRRDTCTATRIEPPRHRFIENTIPSIEAAFRAGATMVELDIHPTTDKHLAVFHDWTLDCRTDGRGVTHEHEMTYLQSLDVGYGYTTDGGRTFPLRGAGRGLMPDLDAVFAAFPTQKLLIDQKDRYDRTIELLAAAVNRLPPPQRARVFYWNDRRDYEKLARRAPQVRKFVPSRPEMFACAKAYALRLGLGALPDACRSGIAIPARYLPFTPGWPGLILQKARTAGVDVIVIDVDSEAQARRVARLPVDAIMTNRIDELGGILRATPTPRAMIEVRSAKFEVRIAN